MGCWNATDMVTGLPIMYEEPIRCLVIQQTREFSGHANYPDDLWRPVGLPVCGTYNDYGMVKAVKPGLAADYLAHLLPLTSDMEEEIRGCGAECASGVERKLLAVERGCSALDRLPLTLCMVREETWGLMRKLKTERRELFERRFREDVRRLRELARLPREQDGFLDLAVRDLVRNSAPFMEKMWFWVKTEELNELIDLAVEFKLFHEALMSLRRQYQPSAGCGSQSTDWEAHRKVAELVMSRCAKEIKRSKD